MIQVGVAGLMHPVLGSCDFHLFDTLTADIFLQGTCASQIIDQDVTSIVVTQGDTVFQQFPDSYLKIAFRAGFPERTVGIRMQVRFTDK